MKLYVQRLSPDEPFQAPSRAYPDDVGLDLYCSRSVVLQPKAFAKLFTNIAIAVERGGWVWLTERSSAFYKRNLIVHQGKIDPGFRGEITPLVYNPTDQPIRVAAGDRLFQMVLMPDATKVEMVLVDRLPDSERGVGGFGSSGR